MTRGIKRDVVLGKRWNPLQTVFFFLKIDPIPFSSLTRRGVLDSVNLGPFVSGRCECIHWCLP